MKAILFALALAATGTPAFAQDCPSAPALIAGTSASEAAILATGQAVLLGLKPAPQVKFAATARRGDDPKTWGGVAAFTIATAGVWRVSLGSGAWIAVLQDGAEVRSTAHSHGESCFTKMVDFPLHAGKAVIEISASPDGVIRLMAAPAG